MSSRTNQTPRAGSRRGSEIAKNKHQQTRASSSSHEAARQPAPPSSVFSRYLGAHPAVQRVAAAACVLCLVVGLAIGMTAAFNTAAVERQDAKDSLDSFAGLWRTQIGTRFTEAISVATSAAAFAAGGAPGVPNHNGTRAERIQLIRPSTWPSQGARLFRQVPGLLAIELASSGIISQTYPHDPASIGHDLLLDLAFQRMIVANRNIVDGPIKIYQGGLGFLMRAPVYLDRAGGLANFWGAATLVFRVADLMNAMNISEDFERNGYDFAFVRRELFNESSEPEIVLQSRPNIAVPLSGGVSYQMELDSTAYNLTVTIAPRTPIPSGNPRPATVAAIVAAVLGITLLAAAAVFAVAYVAHAARHSAVPHRSAAAAEPTAMALVSVKSMTWWKEHADAEQLHDDLLRFQKLTAELASAHGCHASGRISDGCVLVVASDVAKLRRFAGEVRTGLTVESDAKTRNTAEDGLDAPPRPRDSRAGSDAGTHARFRFGVALHVGELSSTYDAVQDCFTFHGPGIAAAARAVDATRGGEVSATEDFANAHADLIGEVPERVDCFDGDECVSRYVVESRSSYSDCSLNDTPRRDSTGSGGGNDSSVATSLSAQTGTVLRKVVAVLHVELLPMATPRSDYAEVLKSIVDVVAAHNGEVAATTGSTVTVLFNARVSTSAAATRAVHTDEALRVALQPRGVRVLSTVATGSCLVATVEGRAMCVGAPMTRALRLHAGLVAASLDEPQIPSERQPPMLRTCVVDGVSVEVVRRAFEVQCIGAFGFDGALGYAVEQEWATVTGDADDEWLYRLQKMEQLSAFTPLNAAFELLKANPASDKARAAAAAVLNGQASHRPMSPQTAPLAASPEEAHAPPGVVVGSIAATDDEAEQSDGDGAEVSLDPYAVQRLAAMLRRA